MSSSRHFPTFAKLPERRYARPCDAYDVMRTADSWLAANLVDQIMISEQEEQGVADSAHRWQVLFKKVLRDLSWFGWRENCRLHLS